MFFYFFELTDLSRHRGAFAIR